MKQEKKLLGESEGGWEGNGMGSHPGKSEGAAEQDSGAVREGLHLRQGCARSRSLPGHPQLRFGAFSRTLDS